MFPDCVKHFPCVRGGEVIFRVCNDPRSDFYRACVADSVCWDCTSRLDLSAEGPQPLRSSLSFSATPRQEIAFQVSSFRDGIIVYEKKEGDWEPPPVPSGWQRKCSDPRSQDAWTLLPVFGPCQHRAFERLTDKSCGSINLKVTCQGTPINPRRCIDCTRGNEAP
jgi:hypothetical protein